MNNKQKCEVYFKFHKESADAILHKIDEPTDLFL
ncbi:hypothetical protein SDC9_56844 [bioreactor metagenome]|uniref:Uncharacterized protein n=1 Tax=bioreactor metagenome TaxID=1076179 RepID=A0A644X2Y1_9ZZZZ